MQERKDVSQKQNKRIKSQANLQNRRRQEKQQRERRKKDLLAITFQREVPRLGLGLMAGPDSGTGGRHLQSSESRDNLQHLQHRHLANVHSDQPGQPGQAGDAGGRKVAQLEAGAEAERRERVQKVEQTTVHTVITTHEKLGRKHLPAITGETHPAVHGAARASSISGSDKAGEQQQVVVGPRYDGGHRAPSQSEPRYRHSDGGSGGGGGGGVSHLRSMVRTEPLESRAGEEGEM